LYDKEPKDAGGYENQAVACFEMSLTGM